MHITVNAEKTLAALKAAEAAALDLAPVFRQIGEIVTRSVRENFREGGRPQKWTPLAIETLMGKAGGMRAAYTKKGGRLRNSARKRILGNKILIDTGRLINSITYVVGPRDVEIGTNVEYAAVHQFGDKHIPARPFLMLQRQDETTISELVEKRIGRPLQ
jgi:phage virion morphogenesis protein